MRPGPSPFVLLRANRLSLRCRINTSAHVRRSLTSAPEPSIYARFAPAAPFIFWWTVITSLAVHQLRVRHRAEDEQGVAKAKISVLEGLISRMRNGEELHDDELRKELEMVGLRERTKLSEGDEEALKISRDVGWGEALFGRRYGRKTAEEEDKDAVIEWAKVVEEATQPATDASAASPTAPAPSSQPQRTGVVRRAPGATVYL